MYVLQLLEALKRKCGFLCFAFSKKIILFLPSAFIISGATGREPLGATQIFGEGTQLDWLHSLWFLDRTLEASANLLFHPSDQAYF